MEGGTTQSPPLNNFEYIINSVRDRGGGLILRSDSNSSSEIHPSLTDSTPTHPPNSVPIDPIIFKHLVNGNKQEILALRPKLAQLKSSEDDESILHISASNSSPAGFISDILPYSKNIITWKSSKGDLAFHSAAKAGQLNCLKALTDWNKYDPGENEINFKLLGRGNVNGDTPLHIALENEHPEMAEYLVDQYGEACYMLNEKSVCPIYQAIQAGYWDLVEKMVGMDKERMVDVDAGKALLEGKSVVHAAIEAQNIEILSLILNKFRDLIKSQDDVNQTPLSYAASKGYLKGVQYLLKEFPESAYECDKDKEGSFPIHKAASGGHIKVIDALHNTRQLRNRKGQNILHIAAGNGQSDVISHLLKIPELQRLINLKDEDGNSPLHLAALGFHPRVVYILTRERKVKQDMKNKNGLTALDVVEIHAGLQPNFEARLTWMALRYVDAPRSSQLTRKSYMKQKQKEEEQMYRNTGQRMSNKKNDKKQQESYKERIGTLLLVSTLVATVTFAAGFTLPGGYKQDEPDIGLTVLPHKWAFQVFVICNTAAMYSSILAVVTLIWAQLSDLKLILVSLRFALPVLGFALAMMSLAFMMGGYVVLRNQPWLSYVVLVLGSVFFVAVLLFFIPLYNPSYIRNPIARFFFSGTFLLLLLVCENSHGSSFI